MSGISTAYNAVLGSSEKWEESSVKPAQESLAKFFNIPVDSIRGEHLVGKDLEHKWTFGDSAKLGLAKIAEFAVRHPVFSATVVAVAGTFIAAAAGSTTAAGIISQAGSAAGTAIKSGLSTAQYYAQGALTGHMPNGQTWYAAVVKPFADFIGGNIGVKTGYLTGKYSATFGADKALYASIGKIATTLVSMPKVLASIAAALAAGTTAGGVALYQHFNPSEVEVPGETVIVEVPGETVIVEVPGETVIVELPGETNIVHRPRTDDGRGGKKVG